MSTTYWPFEHIEEGIFEILHSNPLPLQMTQLFRCAPEMTDIHGFLWNVKIDKL